MFRFPWTNEHELNLDWIIKTVKSLLRRVKKLEDEGFTGGVTSVNGATGDVIIPVASPATINPEPLAQYPAIGIDDGYARGDHVHPLPSASDVGAITSPSSPATGAFLVWDGAAWVAQTLSVWQGGNY